MFLLAFKLKLRKIKCYICILILAEGNSILDTKTEPHNSKQMIIILGSSSSCQLIGKSPSMKLDFLCILNGLKEEKRARLSLSLNLVSRKSFNLVSSFSDKSQQCNFLLSSNKVDLQQRLQLLMTKKYHSNFMLWGKSNPLAALSTYNCE